MITSGSEREEREREREITSFMQLNHNVKLLHIMTVPSNSIYINRAATVGGFELHCLIVDVMLLWSSVSGLELRRCLRHNLYMVHVCMCEEQ